MRITQTSDFLVSLVREVATGRMLPAAMQRPYVWGKADVEALCDSILSGFPVGSFLLWAPGAKADLSTMAKPRLGPIAPGSTEGAPPYKLLLDGQNRLATMAWMMTEEPAAVPEPSDAERETWLSGNKLVLDFATRSMHFVPAEQAESGLRLPAWTVLADSRAERFNNAMRLIRKKNDVWLKDFTQEQIDELLTFWDRARDSFRDARTATTIIENATAEQARHAFLRICRVGVPMTQEDFDRAVGWTGEAA